MISFVLERWFVDTINYFKKGGIVMNRGLFVVFESVSKCGKTTLANGLEARLKVAYPLCEVFHKRGALSRSDFGKEVTKRNIEDLGYSTAFYWADLVFDSQDTQSLLQRDSSIIIQERYDLSIVAYREIHGFFDDCLLLDAYHKRKMLLTPDLTVFLDAPTEVIIERINSSCESTNVDKAFGKKAREIRAFQQLIRNHLNDMGRHTLHLDTSEKSIQECLRLTHEEITKLRKE